MKAVLNLDDFSPVNNRLDVLLKLKDYFPDFKVSMFTVPIDTKMDWGPYCIRPQLLKEVKKHLDWIQIIPHAYRHTNANEMKHMSYEEFKAFIPKIEQAFKDDGLPYVKGFKSPHWKQSKGVARALDEAGWWSAVLRDDFPPMNSTKRFYKFTHLLNEPFWESDLPVLKLHGHIYGTKNDLGINLDNILRLPKDTKWDYATDHIETVF